MLEYHLIQCMINDCLVYDINNLNVIVIHVQHFFSSLNDSKLIKLRLYFL